MGRRRIRLQNDVTADLIDQPIIPMLNEPFDQITPAQIARQFHAKTSSRTRCSRKRDGAGRSK